MRTFLILTATLAILTTTQAWMPASAYRRSVSSSAATSSSTALAMQSRQAFFQTAAAGVASALLLEQSAWADETAVKLPSGVSYVVKKQGNGPQAEVGELVAIRFAAYVNDGQNKLDDIFDTPEPYYTRVGSGGLVKGVEEVLPMMRLGDRWVLTIPGDMAFGKKGRPSSAGKPRIPGDAVITFDLEMVGLPGKEQELIELIGDD